MNPPKIAVFAHCCALQVNRRIYERMASDGWQVGLFVPLASTTPVEPEANGIPVTLLAQRGNKSRFYVYQDLERHLREFMPDQILLDLEPDSLLACQLARWCSRHGRKLFVQTCENQGIWATTVNSPFPLRGAILLIRKLILSYTVPRISHAFSISSRGDALLGDFGFQTNKSRIPLGVDTTAFYPNPEYRQTLRQSWGVSEETVLIAYFGRLIRGKGVHLLLEALIQLADVPWMLVMDDFRSDSDSDYIQEIALQLKHPLLANRVIPIHAKHAEMPKFLNAVDVVAVPSIRESAFLEQYGRIVPEALACGVEVLISDSGALPEVGGNMTTQFPEGSVPHLVAALAEAFATPNSIRKQETARRHQWVVQHSSLDRQWEIMKPVLSQ